MLAYGRSYADTDPPVIPASVNGLGVRPPPPTLALPDLEEMEDEVFLEAPGRDADYDEDMGCGDPSNRAKPRAAWGDETVTTHNWPTGR